MNIVLLNHYAGSPDMGMEFRPYYMAREWIKKGHNVTIIAGDYSHLRTQNPVVHEDFCVEKIEGIEYCWVQTGKYEGNGVKRALSMIKFVGKIYNKAEWINEKFKPDIVIASSTYPIDTYAAQRICKYSQARYIHEIHDMWPISPMELGNMSKYNPFIILMQMGENSFCKKADKVVSLLPNAKSYLMEHKMTGNKFYCVPNGIVLEDWQNAENLPEEHQKVFEKLKNEGKKIVGFFGSHTKSYALKYLIDAVIEIKRDDLCVVFVGKGNEKDDLIKYTKDYRNQFVFLPPIKKQSIPKLVEEFDYIYVGALKNDMFRFGICMNKLFDSMMSGKPILYAVEAPNNYILDYKCGISVEAESVTALKIGLERLLNMEKSQLEEMGRNGKNAVLENFEYKVIAKKFLDIMNDKEEIQ